MAIFNWKCHGLFQVLRPLLLKGGTLLRLPCSRAVSSPWSVMSATLPSPICLVRGELMPRLVFDPGGRILVWQRRVTGYLALDCACLGSAGDRFWLVERRVLLLAAVDSGKLLPVGGYGSQHGLAGKNKEQRSCAHECGLGFMFWAHKSWAWCLSPIFLFLIFVFTFFEFVVVYIFVRPSGISLYWVPFDGNQPPY